MLAFNGVADHVHLLVRFPTTVSIAELVKQVKGVSSHLLGRHLRVPFKRRSGYGAFTLSKSQAPRVRQYVLDQQRHHADRTTSRGRVELMLPIPIRPATAASPAFRP